MRAALLGSDRDTALALAERWLAEAGDALDLLFDHSKSKWRQRFSVRTERLLAGYELVTSAMRWTGAWTPQLGYRLWQSRARLLAVREMLLMPLERDFAGQWLGRTGFEWSGSAYFFTLTKFEVSDSFRSVYVNLGWVLLLAVGVATGPAGAPKAVVLTLFGLFALWKLLTLAVDIDVKVEGERIQFRFPWLRWTYRQLHFRNESAVIVIEDQANWYRVGCRQRNRGRFRTLFQTSSSVEAQRLLDAIRQGRGEPTVTGTWAQAVAEA